MKQNKMNIKQERSIREWEELVERYFDALTTDAEEQQLRSFLLSSEAVGEVFDEAKAVMGFLEVGQSVHQEKKGSLTLYIRCSAFVWLDLATYGVSSISMMYFIVSLPLPTSVHRAPGYLPRFHPW